MSERCNDPLNIGGEGFNCDQEAKHPLPHMSKLAHAIWGSDDIAARERERIVGWIRTSIGDEADTGELADDIARGAHLEASRG